jgi:hypothetical protein
MRRDLKVNAGQDSEEEPDPSWDFGALKWPGRDDMPGDSGTVPAPASGMRSYGTCLYFGPAGQRCDRPAGESGFCHVHLGNIEGKPSAKPGKVIAAIMAILALLWPVLSDVVQFIMRWIRQHHGF